MIKGFVIKCKNCGKEVELIPDGNGEVFNGDGIKACVTMMETLDIECDCGNEKV